MLPDFALFSNRWSQLLKMLKKIKQELKIILEVKLTTLDLIKCFYQCLWEVFEDFSTEM